MPIRGTRSYVPETWTCEEGHVNPPQKLLLFDIPTLICGCGCKEKYCKKFEICMGDIKANGHGLLGKALDQGKEEVCVAAAFAKLMEITKKVKAVSQGKYPDHIPQMSFKRLMKTYKQIVDKHEVGCGLSDVIIMARILKEQGIESTDQKTIYKASDVSVVRRKDTEGIVRNLADGYPLHAGIVAGRRLKILRFCQAYKPPGHSKLLKKIKSRKLKIIPTHSVVIIGAGMKKGKMYFFFLNSWKDFCVRVDSQGRIIRHGIGKVSARRLYRNLVRVSRYKEATSERSLEKQLVIPVSKECHNFKLMMSSQPTA